jgi:CubicO group peptidase (beta-lactamase class C family)
VLKHERRVQAMTQAALEEKMLKLVVLLLLVLAPQVGVAQLPRPVEEKVTAKFRTLVSSGGFPSVAVGIVRGDQLIYASAFGATDSKTKQPMQALLLPMG